MRGSKEQRALTVGGRHLYWLGIGLTIVSISLLAACGESQERSDSKRPLRWRVVESKGPRQVTVRGPVSNCEGLPEPRVLEVVKSYRGRRVYVRIVADVPAEARDPQEFVCAGVGLELEETISLPRPLKELVLFDSGVDPPAQRWPEIPSK